jgi:hypothetical protein
MLPTDLAKRLTDEGRYKRSWMINPRLLNLVDEATRNTQCIRKMVLEDLNQPQLTDAEKEDLYSIRTVPVVVPATPRTD